MAVSGFDDLEEECSSVFINTLLSFGLLDQAR